MTLQDDAAAALLIQATEDSTQISRKLIHFRRSAVRHAAEAGIETETTDWTDVSDEAGVYKLSATVDGEPLLYTAADGLVSWEPVDAPGTWLPFASLVELGRLFQQHGDRG